MDDKERTLFCGNLSEKVTEDLLYELFLQAGPLESVSIPKEKDGRQKNFGFVKFKHPVSVQYSVALMDGVSLFGRTLRLDQRSGSSNASNPYLDKLRQYQQVQNQNDHRSSGSSRQDRSRQDSRRHDPRNDLLSRRPDFGSRSVPTYPGFGQVYVLPQPMPAQRIIYPMSYAMYPLNQYPKYR